MEALAYVTKINVPLQTNCNYNWILTILPVLRLSLPSIWIILDIACIILEYH